MLSTWAITALVLSTCVFAGELVPISPYPDARVFKGYQYECPSAKVMLADKWTLETTTPYPLERAYGILVDDTVTFSTRNSNLMIRKVTKCGPTIPQAKNGNI